MDVRPGARWRFESHADDGTMNSFSSEYREIAEPERLVQTFMFDPFPDSCSVETATWAELGDGRTKFTVHAQHDDKRALDGMIASGVESGMNDVYDRLDVLLQRRGAGA